MSSIFSLVAWAVCGALFLLQGLFGLVLTLCLLGHLSQLLPSGVFPGTEEEPSGLAILRQLLERKFEKVPGDSIKAFLRHFTKRG